MGFCTLKLCYIHNDLFQVIIPCAIALKSNIKEEGRIFVAQYITDAINVQKCFYSLRKLISYFF
jgi:hypothetical protein